MVVMVSGLGLVAVVEVLAVAALDATKGLATGEGSGEGKGPEGLAISGGGRNGVRPCRSQVVHLETRYLI